MLGAITGDIVGSVYEWNSIKTTDFPLFSPGCRFTDDTVLTCAIAHAILTESDYGEALRQFASEHPRRGYGGMFRAWVRAGESEPYYSFGNGSAMRVSPVGFAFGTVDEALAEARKSAEVTHNHPEGIKGAQATALAIFLARTGADKHAIRTELTERFGYSLDRTLEEIRPSYDFDVTCQGSVPEAIIAFLEADSFESAIRNAVSLGGDADTQACIAGGIAEAFFGLPEEIGETARGYLPQKLREIVDEFEGRRGDS